MTHGDPIRVGVFYERGNTLQAFNLDKMETVCLANLSAIMKTKAEHRRPPPPGPPGPPGPPLPPGPPPGGFDIFLFDWDDAFGAPVR